MTAELRVETIATNARFEALEGEWNALLARSCHPLPFLLHEWLFTWWRHYRRDDRSTRDSLQIKTIRDETGTLVGIAPLMLTERPAMGPVRSRTLRMLGADPYITELRSCIVDRTQEAEVARVLAGHLAGETNWDWLQWSGLLRDSDFARTFHERLPLKRGLTFAASVLAVPGSWDEFRSTLRRNIKESLRHCYNSLRRDGHELDVQIACEPSMARPALGTFFKLHSMRANMEGGVRHADRFERSLERKFLEDVVHRLAENGVTRIVTLSVKNRPVASRVAFAVGGCLYLYYSGFDPAWGKYSVATTAVAEAIKYAVGQRIGSVHLSTGLDRSKSRWAPTESFFDDAIHVRRSLFSQAAFGCYAWLRDEKAPRAMRRMFSRAGAG
jgi:CelD/BcsL family acetyltransferase involved in cellulose biosynthesis